MVIKISKKSFSINGYSLHNQSRTRLNIPFLFSQIFIDSLLKLKSNENDQNNLIRYLQHEYQNNPNELNNIQEFKENYLSNKVLWWYKRKDFFFSSTLNAVLKTENLSMMFLFRSFLFDIKEQLRKYQPKQRLKVYRSQIMSIGDYYYYINNAISYLPINSFLSTTKSYSTACSLFDQLDIDSQSTKVIFEIDADPNVVTSKPFSDISELNNHSEILFMPGSIFRIEKCVHELSEPNIIQMTLCNENDFNLNEQIGNDMINPRLIEKIVSKMDKNDLAKKYFQRLIEQLSSNDLLLADLYQDLSQVLSQIGDDQMSKKCICAADSGNHRIVQCRFGTNDWQVVAGGNEEGNRLDQLKQPMDVETDELYNGHVIIANIYCYALAIDKDGNLYTLDTIKREVRRGNKEETFIATENEDCIPFKQLQDLHAGFVNDTYSVYVSTWSGRRITKSEKGSKEGIVVAGGPDALIKTEYAEGLFVNHLGEIFVADNGDRKITC
ncbi:unnamed protein product [Adineta steineri]|uniref:Uncharacterized protein n=1 Tax=Adineta steineri TaxID=433720 RepID=A0A813NC36_9BILA|nr:unnamed protein product [Adineta steineri]CAF4029642.1 unnamed protein product [Adineta steineri]